MLHRLLALRPLLFHACVVADFESIRRDRAIRSAVAGPDDAVPDAVPPDGEVRRRPPGHVHFWPGSPQGPIAAGRERIERHRWPGELRILRAYFNTVLQRNPARECHVSFMGAAASGVDASDRAAPRLQSIHAGRWSAADVREVAFTDFVDLPHDTMWADSLAGPWRPL